MKTREQWEQDLRRRQHNYVFPETVLNQADMYRGMLRGGFPLTPFQRAAMVVIGMMLLAGARVCGAACVTEWSASESGSRLYGLGSALFGIFLLVLSIRLIVRTVFPPQSIPSHAMRNRPSGVK